MGWRMNYGGRNDKYKRRNEEGFHKDTAEFLTAETANQ